MRPLFALLLVLSACAPELALEAKYAPLVSVVEDASVPGTDPAWTQVNVSHAHVHDLAAWQRAVPAGSVERDALLSHERVHAERQASAGYEAWTRRYRSDSAFRWSEEKLGYAVEFEVLLAAGHRVDAVFFANVLSGPGYGFMVDHPTALAWVVSRGGT